MAHEAARLVHPEGSHEEHAEIAKAVLADKPLPKTASKKAKAAATTLRDKSTPTGLWGRYIYRLHGIAADAHAGDKATAAGRTSSTSRPSPTPSQTTPSRWRCSTTRWRTRS